MKSLLFLVFGLVALVSSSFSQQINPDTNWVIASSQEKAIFIGWNEPEFYFVKNQHGYVLTEKIKNGDVILKEFKTVDYTHAGIKLLSDSSTLLITWEGNFSEKGYHLGVLYSIINKKFYQLPEGIISHNYWGGPKNWTIIKEFIYDGLMYKAFFDPEKEILFFGQTLSTVIYGDHGFRRGLRTSTIESYDFKKGVHENLHPGFLIKANWSINEGVFTWWSPVVEKNQTVTWFEYQNGSWTGRKFYATNHMWPKISGNTAVIPTFVGNYDLVKTDTIRLSYVINRPVTVR